MQSLPMKHATFDPSLWWSRSRAVLLFGLAGILSVYAVPSLVVQAVDAIMRGGMVGVGELIALLVVGPAAVGIGIALPFALAFVAYHILDHVESSVWRALAVGGLSWPIFWMLTGQPAGWDSRIWAVMPGAFLGLAISRMRPLASSLCVEAAAIAFVGFAVTNFALATSAFYFRFGILGWFLVFVAVPLAEIAFTVGMRARGLVPTAFLLGALLAAPVGRVFLPVVVSVPAYQEFAGTFRGRQETPFDTLHVSTCMKPGSTKFALVANSAKGFHSENTFPLFLNSSVTTIVRVAVYEIDLRTGDARMMALIVPPEATGPGVRAYDIQGTSWDGDVIQFGLHVHSNDGLIERDRVEGYRIAGPGRVERVNYRSIVRYVRDDAAPETRQFDLQSERAWLARYAIDPESLLPAPKIPLNLTTADNDLRTGAVQIDNFGITAERFKYYGRLDLSVPPGAWPAEFWVQLSVVPPEGDEGSSILLDPIQCIPYVNHSASDGGDWGPTKRLEFAGSLPPDVRPELVRPRNLWYAIATTRAGAKLATPKPISPLPRPSVR